MTEPNKKPNGLAAAIAAAVIAIAAIFVGPWEGRELKPYRDIVGVWTVCEGHTGADIVKDKVYTNAECDALLRTDVAKAYAHVARCIPQDLPVKTLAALTSAAFNLGQQVVCGSTLQKHAKAHRIAQTCLELLRWNRAGGKVVRGLVRRRDAEYKLCMEGFGK